MSRLEFAHLSRCVCVCVCKASVTCLIEQTEQFEWLPLECRPSAEIDARVAMRLRVVLLLVCAPAHPQTDASTHARTHAVSGDVAGDAIAELAAAAAIAANNS